MIFIFQHINDQLKVVMHGLNIRQKSVIDGFPYRLFGIGYYSNDSLDDYTIAKYITRHNSVKITKFR